MNTFKRKALFIPVLLVLTGCVQGVTTQAQFDKAIELCVPHGGVAVLYPHEETRDNPRVDVKCNNGVRIQAWIKIA